MCYTLIGDKMKKGIKILLVIIFIIIVGVGSYFISKNVTDNYLRENNTVEDIKLKNFVINFNKNLKNNKIDVELSINEVEANENSTYWINLEEGIDIAIMMDKVSDNKESDTVRITGLAYATNYEDTGKINNYLKALIKTNNSNLNNDDINKMIKNADNMKDSIKEEGNETSKTFDYKGLGIDKNINSESTIYRIARYNEY